MKEEEIMGPMELVLERSGIDEGDENQEDSKEGSKYQMERLRKYQLNRLKYYYAVVACDSVETASKLYSECDGLEYESSSTRLDLRFIPDDVDFDQKPKEVCTEIQDADKYQPRFFVNTALQQGKVSCTWDETDPAREQLAAKLHQSKGNADGINDADLQVFLASSSEDEEINDEEHKSNKVQENDVDDDDDDNDDDDDDEESGTSKSIEKYRNLLNKIQDDEAKKKNRDVEMEITWGVGLKDKTKSLVDKKLKENEMTPFEKMIEKKKEKRKQKREEKVKKKSENNVDDSGNESDENSETRNAAFSDDELPDDIDLDDDYFKEEFAGAQLKTAKKKKDKMKKKRKDDDDVDSGEEKKRNELELLLIDEEDEKTGKSHFNLKAIQENEENQGKKKKKGRKQLKKKQQQESIVEDDFQVDLKDERFNAVFTMSEYNIDPSDSHYRKTKGMDALIQEKIKRKYKEENGSGVEHKPNKMHKLDSELSNVVASIKKKTKGFK